MPRPISAESRTGKYWDNMIVLMGRLKSAMLIDGTCPEVLKRDTCETTDYMIELALKHKARFEPELADNTPPKRVTSKR